MNQTSIRKLMWGVGAKYKKIYSRKGKLNEKNSWTPINPKKIFMLWPKKNSCKEFDNEKKILAAPKFPSPHNFSNSPSLILSFLGRGAGDGGRGTGRWAVSGDGGSLYF